MEEITCVPSADVRLRCNCDQAGASPASVYFLFLHEFALAMMEFHFGWIHRNRIFGFWGGNERLKADFPAVQ